MPSRSQKLKIKKTSAASDYSSAEPVSVDVEEQDVPIGEDIQDQDEGPAPSLIDKARSILGTSVDNVQTKLGPEPTQGRKKWVNPKSREKQEASVTTVMVSIIVILVAGWQVPDELKPNDEEIEGVAGLATSILLRHVNLSGRMTQDVMDTIGILAIISSYYARTSAGWKTYGASKKIEPVYTEKGEPDDIPIVDEAQLN